MEKAAAQGKPAKGGAGTNDIRFRSQFRKTELCAFYMQGWCSKGERCEFAHGAHEVQSMPDLTKTSLCKKWLKFTCPLQSAQCPFAHGAKELRVTKSYVTPPSKHSRKALPGGHGAEQQAKPCSSPPRSPTRVSAALAPGGANGLRLRHTSDSSPVFVEQPTRRLGFLAAAGQAKEAGGYPRGCEAPPTEQLLGSRGSVPPHAHLHKALFGDVPHALQSPQRVPLRSRVAPATHGHVDFASFLGPLAHNHSGAYLDPGLVGLEPGFPLDWEMVLAGCPCPPLPNLCADLVPHLGAGRSLQQAPRRITSRTPLAPSPTLAELAHCLQEPGKVNEAQPFVLGKMMYTDVLEQPATSGHRSEQTLSLGAGPEVGLPTAAGVASVLQKAMPDLYEE